MDAVVPADTPSRKPRLLTLLKHPIAGAVLSAILLAFCFPFASAWWLTWIALVPWYLSLLFTGGNGKRGFVSGFWFGVTLHLVGMFWMSKLGTVPWVVLSIIESFWFAVMGAIAAPVLSRLPGWGRPLFFAAFWCCLEFARSWGTCAFPWFLLAAAQVPCLPMVQIVEVTGQWGLSCAIAAVNAFIAEAIFARELKDTKSIRLRLIPALCIPLVLVIAGKARMLFVEAANVSSDGNPPQIKLGIVQGNIDKIPENASPDVLDEYRWRTLSTYVNMTRYMAQQNRDLSFILWPETVVPGYMLQDPNLRVSITGLARDVRTDLLVGTMDASGTINERFNSVVYVDKGGLVRYNYAKQHLVPMGEFFLFRELLGKIYDQYGVPNEDLTPGRAAGAFAIGDGANTTKIGMLICYESVFPEISRDRVRHGARLMVQATSDQTFDNTPNPQQHADLAVLRAIETRRYFVRAGATGLSEVVIPDGRVRRKIPSLKAGTIVDTVVLHDDQTFFVRYGDWFVTLCAVGLLAGITFALNHKGKVAVPATQAPASEQTMSAE